MRTAALSASERTTRPVGTNFSGQVPPNRAGQFTDNSTIRPIGNRCSVVNRMPLLPIFKVFPAPVVLSALPWMILYLTSSRTGNLVVPRRSGRPPMSMVTFSELRFILFSIMREGVNSYNRPKAPKPDAFVRYRCKVLNLQPLRLVLSTTYQGKLPL